MVENLRITRKKEKEKKRRKKKKRRLYISIKQATGVCRWKCCRAFCVFVVVAFISPFLGLCVMLVCPSFTMALYHLLALYSLLQMGFGTLQSAFLLLFITLTGWLSGQGFKQWNEDDQNLCTVCNPVGVWDWLADALGCKSSRQGLGCDGWKTFFQFFPVNTCAESPVPVTPLCARQTFWRRLCMLKIPCPFFDKRRPNSWWCGNTDST